MTNTGPRPAAPDRILPEIYVYTTAKHFLNIYDALRIEKCKIEIARYDPATSKQTGRATAWLDLDEIRLLVHLVTFRLFPIVLAGGGRPPRFEKFGGSEREGRIESRTLLLEWDPGPTGRFAGYPYRLTITNGPGLRLATGAVQPQGEPTSTQGLRLPEADLIEILLAVGAYVRVAEQTLLPAKAAARRAERRSSRADREDPRIGSPAAEHRVRTAAPEEPPNPEPPTRARPEGAPPPPGPAPRPMRPGGRPDRPRSAPARPAAPDDPWAGMEVSPTPPPPPVRRAYSEEA